MRGRQFKEYSILKNRWPKNCFGGMRIFILFMFQRDYFKGINYHNYYAEYTTFKRFQYILPNCTKGSFDRYGILVMVELEMLQLVMVFGLVY